MSLFKKESLELLRRRIDLPEFLSSYIPLKRSGSAFKGLCPFHEEKTPSFIVQRGDTHYHCFGCGAHGDAIDFLTNHEKMSFTEAVESLASRFNVLLEHEEGDASPAGPKKSDLKDTLEKAKQFYHFFLLNTEEGQKALPYFFSRGMDQDFIKTFELGLSPRDGHFLQKTLTAQRVPLELMELSGLVKMRAYGEMYDFFSDRIMIPIHDQMGAVIGFSARKYREETFGPKYVNSPETPLFQKSKVLFGLNYSRKRMVKERRAIIVEGQFDALRLIFGKYDFTVAGQGTAFGEDHVRQVIDLGVNHVFIATDPDKAGYEAAHKIGQLFQKRAIEVSVVMLPEGCDPDSFFRDHGPEAWRKALDGAIDYLSFLVKKVSSQLNINSPAGKTEMVQTLAAQIRTWDEPIMVHESLKKLAELTATPVEIFGALHASGQQVFVRRPLKIKGATVDYDRVLETDLLRWLYIDGGESEQMAKIAKRHLEVAYFRIPVCRNLFERYSASAEANLVINIEEEAEREVLCAILQKKINKEKAMELFVLTVNKLLEREWQSQMDQIQKKIHSGESDDETLLLAKEYAELQKAKPQVDL